MFRALVILVCLLTTIPALGTSLLVLPDGSGPYLDLQTAVAAAAPGDTIMLGDGVFAGAGNRNLIVADRSLTFRSQGSDPTACVVELEGEVGQENRFVHCTGAAGQITLEDLTLRNGRVWYNGGGIWVQEGTAVLKGCVLEACEVASGHGAGGGAVNMSDGSLLVTGCSFAGNRAAGLNTGGVGGAIDATDSWVEIRESAFTDNSAAGDFDTGGRGGAMTCRRGTLIVESCSFQHNKIGGSNMGVSYGGAVMVDSGQVTVNSTVFAANEVWPYGFGLGCGSAFAIVYYEARGGAQFTSCTFADNIAGFEGGTVYARDANIGLDRCIITGALERKWLNDEPLPGVAAATFLGGMMAIDCDVWGNGGDWTGPLEGQGNRYGNFSANPCFCDAFAGNHHLCADSWCAPENNVAHPGVLVGALPVGCEACECEPGPTAVDHDLAAPLRLLGAAPNPFNPATVVRYSMAAPGLVHLTVHDLAGRHLATLVDGPRMAGEQAVTWRGRDDAGRAVSGGAYLLRLEVAGVVVTDKLTLLR